MGNGGVSARAGGGVRGTQVKSDQKASLAGGRTCSIAWRQEKPGAFEELKGDNWLEGGELGKWVSQESVS